MPASNFEGWNDCIVSPPEHMQRPVVVAASRQPNRWDRQMPSARA
jgi:hypothetical protein